MEMDVSLCLCYYYYTLYNM